MALVWIRAMSGFVLADRVANVQICPLPPSLPLAAGGL